MLIHGSAWHHGTPGALGGRLSERFLRVVHRELKPRPNGILSHSQPGLSCWVKDIIPHRLGQNAWLQLAGLYALPLASLNSASTRGSSAEVSTTLNSNIWLRKVSDLIQSLEAKLEALIDKLKPRQTQTRGASLTIPKRPEASQRGRGLGSLGRFRKLRKVSEASESFRNLKES